MSGPDPNEAIREAARAVLREMVPEIVRELSADSQTRAPDSKQTNGNGHTNGHTNGHGQEQENGHGRAPHPDTGDETLVPQVPAPPVAAVLRPSTWDRPAAPGEVIGAPANGAPANGAPAAATGEKPAPPVQSPAPPTPPGEPQLKLSGDDARVETVTIDTDEDLERFIRELITRLENPRDRLAIRKGQLRFSLGRSETVGEPKKLASVRVKKGAVTERVIRQAASAGTRLVLEPGAVLTPLARDEAKALGVQIERERRC
jgi:hypothetical protein